MNTDSYNLKITPIKQSSTSMYRIASRRVVTKDSQENFYNKKKNSPLTSQNSSISRIQYLKYKTLGRNL